MTKADRIRQLAGHGIFTTREIAANVAEEYGSCTPEYVRVCARQRANGASKADQKYVEEFPAKHGMSLTWHRAQKNPAYRALLAGNKAKWVEANPERNREHSRAYQARKREAANV